ncbi:MAG: DUF6161 domain-containing protein [Planctomycetaceae bacterium]
MSVDQENYQPTYTKVNRTILPVDLDVLTDNAALALTIRCCMRLEYLLAACSNELIEECHSLLLGLQKYLQTNSDESIFISFTLNDTLKAIQSENKKFNLAFSKTELLSKQDVMRYQQLNNVQMLFIRTGEAFDSLRNNSIEFRHFVREAIHHYLCVGIDLDENVTNQQRYAFQIPLDRLQTEVEWDFQQLGNLLVDQHQRIKIDREDGPLGPAWNDSLPNGLLKLRELWYEKINARHSENESLEEGLSGDGEKMVGIEEISLDIQQIKDRFEQLDIQSISDRISSLKASFESDLQHLLSETTRLETLVEKVRSDTIDARTQVDHFLTDAKASLETKLIVEEPVKYWKDKSQFHYIWFAVYSVITLAVGGLGVKYLYDIWKYAFGEADVKPWQVGAILFAATILLLLLRVLTRITMSNLHLATEASERGIMMQTYLGLLSQSKLSDERDRSLVLNALFRPSSTGLVKEDSVPSSIFELVARLSSNKQSNN